MIDAVDRLVAERQAMDRGFGRAAALSAAGHVILAFAAIVVPALLPKPPLLRAQSVFYVPLPRGGGGSQQPLKPEVKPAETPKEPERKPDPPKIQKPPKEEPRKGLPAPDAKKGRAKAEEPQPARAADGATEGVSMAPVGPGIPGGTGSSGDWYLAGVQRRVWTIWMSQIRVAAVQPAIVMFTIEANGSVTGVRLLQTCGLSAVDFAAQRAILSAAPFAPLPKHYGTNQLTIQAVFRPTTT